MSLKAAEFIATAKAEAAQDEVDVKDAMIGRLALELMTGFDIKYRTPDYKIHNLNVHDVARRYLSMLDDDAFPYVEQALATLFGSNGEESTLMVNDGYDAAVSLIEQYFESIIELMKEDV